MIRNLLLIGTISAGLAAAPAFAAEEAAPLPAGGPAAQDAFMPPWLAANMVTIGAVTGVLVIGAIIISDDDSSNATTSTN